MIIYNPHNTQILKERIKLAEELLNQIPVKYCFITGSFLYKEKYEDIDVFVISRSKKKLERLRLENKKVKITMIDFNDLYSLFYHSASKSCISKNILPTKPLKVTISDYWHVVNEAIPVILNQKNKFHKDARFLVLYTEYFKANNILDTLQLTQKINEFKNYEELLEYAKMEIPLIMNIKRKKSYIRRFFYSQAGFYKDMLDYKAQKFLYELTHLITRGINHG
ncbi:TPA: hypothetical protein HA246_02805 [Candidatus Woesearchaeota archaeon]|nr:hypothetical protein [Candidatus Woesearchaeota archaeon]